MTHLRQRWEGVSISADYTLEKWLSGDDHTAFFQTSLAPDARPAVIKLVPEAGADGASVLDLWHRTRQLRHPNLVELLDFGRTEHDSETMLYAVFELPDETLAAALSRSPLDPSDSREVLDSVISALRYLHAQGLVAGTLDPDRIVAMDDRVKLLTDTLQEAVTSSACRKDVRLLGNLWEQALLPASPRSAEIIAHAVDPDAAARWTLAEIDAALGPPPAAEPPTPLPVSLPIPDPIVDATPEPAPIVTSRDDDPVPPLPHRNISEQAMPFRFPKWIFALAAGILLLLAIRALNQTHSAAAAPQSVVAPASPPLTTPAPALPPKIAEPERAAPAEIKPSTEPGKKVWRVIAFTYRTREAAARKAQQLNEDHPGINAAVSSHKDKGGFYLVSLGGRMTHQEAERLQHSARGKGLPRDLYVQNYSW